MSSLTIGIITGLLAAVGAGVGDYFAAKSSRTYTPLYAVFWYLIIEVIIAAAVSGAVGWRVHLTWEMVGLGALAGLILLGGLLAAWEAFKRGPVSIASAFVSGNAVVSVVISLLLLHEHLQLYEAVAAALIISGAMLCGFKYKSHDATGFWRRSGTWLAILGAVGIGLAAIMIAIMSRLGGWQTTLVSYSAWGAVFAAIALRIQGQPLVRGRIPVNVNLVMTGLFLGLYGVMVAIGYRVSLVAIVAPISSAAPLITTLLSLLFLKEKISSYQGIGIICIVGSLVLLAIR